VLERQTQQDIDATQLEKHFVPILLLGQLFELTQQVEPRLARGQVAFFEGAEDELHPLYFIITVFFQRVLNELFVLLCKRRVVFDWKRVVRNLAERPF